jgi:hypothetical protein
VDPSYLATNAPKIARGVGDLRASRYRLNEVGVGADTTGGTTVPRTVSRALIETSGRGELLLPRLFADIATTRAGNVA